MTTIDLSSRPDTYWPESPTPELLLSRIRGKVRQDIARRRYAEHGFSALEEFLVKDRLSDEERDAWGAVDPSCLGGEYLPDLLDGEVEIARISMASTTRDQISVRARRQDEVIRYRIVDEYGDEDSNGYDLPFETTARPMTLLELMDLIEGAGARGNETPGGLFTANWQYLYDCGDGPDEIMGFISLSSPFYKEITACYEALAAQWLSDQLTSEQRQRVNELVEGAREELRKRPLVSDEEFMAETEVSDEEYNIGLVLPAIGDKKGGVDE
jgi:hypothetical protein